MRNHRWLAAVLITLAVVVGACSSSSSDASSSTAGSVSAGKGKPIKVGLICACSGTFGADQVVSANAGRAWAKSVNAAGGINGHPVEISVKDDASNPGNSATAAQSLISAHVDVILDVTPLDAVWADAAAKAKIPVVAGDLNNAAFYRNPYFYPSGQTYDHSTVAVVMTAKLAGATKLGQLYCAESPSCQEAVGPVKAAGKNLGIPVTYVAAISATAPNYAAQCLAAKDAGVDAVFIADATSTIVKVISDCARQNYHPKYVTIGSGFSMELPDAVGPKDEVWTEFPILPFFADKAPVQKMNIAMDRYYPGLRKNKESWTMGAVDTWTGGLLIEHAVRAAGLGPSGTPSAGVVLKGLNSLHGDTLNGWSPPLSFTAGHAHSTNCWFIGRTHNGTSELVNDGKLTCPSSTR